MADETPDPMLAIVRNLADASIAQTNDPSEENLAAQEQAAELARIVLAAQKAGDRPPPSP